MTDCYSVMVKTGKVLSGWGLLVPHLRRSQHDLSIRCVLRSDARPLPGANMKSRRGEELFPPSS